MKKIFVLFFTSIMVVSLVACGSNDVKPIHNSGCYGYSPSTDYVTCGNCGAMGGRVKDSNCGKNVEDAIRNWNIRVR